MNITQKKFFLILAGISGFLAVALGAYGSHVLKEIADPKALRSFDIASKYHFYHTIAIVAAVSLAENKIGQISIWFFIVGLFLFSGGIYISILAGIPEFTKITPWGGMSFMIAWLMLAIAALRSNWKIKTLT